MGKQFFVGGNWKSNGTLASIDELVKGLNEGDIAEGVEAVVAPTFLHLDHVKKALKPRFQVSAQNCSLTGFGAFTGEIAAAALVDFGLQWVILGHSERRSLYGESSSLVGEKVKTAQQSGLSVIACIGEKLEERKADETIKVCTEQLEAIAKNVVDWNKVVIAYEPVWAIGTGLTATPEQAQEVHAVIRAWLADKVGADVSKNIRIIYGGEASSRFEIDFFRFC